MRVAHAPLSLLATLFLSASATAQVPPPPAAPAAPGAPAAPAAPAPAAAPGGQPGAPGAQPGVPGAQPGAPGAQPGVPGAQPGVPGAQPGVPGAQPGVPGAQATAGASASVGGTTDPMFDVAGTTGGEEAAANPSREVSDEDRLALRRLSLDLNNNARGTTGLLRISEAYSGAPGTFRMSFLTGFFSGSGFLCDGSEAGGCSLTQATDNEDKVSRVAAHVALSMTFTSFLEGFIGLHANATANDQGRPELLQVLGDSNWGLKAFAPKQPNQIWGVGGELELWMLNGTGGVGVDGSGTSFAMRLLSSVDLANKVSEIDRIPFRGHFNLGYKFNNAGKLVEDVEVERGGGNGVERITRIERFGLDIDRVDTFEIGLGLESPLRYVRPFLEWTFDVPVQRQDYICNISRLDPGDGCLGTDAGFKTTPSRLGLGARVTPGLAGLNLLAAIEIGTGATGSFIEEVAPELPWQIHFGLGYAADAKPAPKAPLVKEVEVERIVPAPREIDRMVVGKVVNADTGEPIPDAIIRYVGSTITGMVSGADGTFTTIGLDPGQYTFALTAADYRDGECVASVPAAAPGGTSQQSGLPEPAAPAAPVDPNAPPAAPTDPAAQPGVPAPAAPTANVTVAANGDLQIAVECKLKALPKVGNVVGTAVDAETGEPVAGAAITIQDKLGRKLELRGDRAGTFRFENVPPGTVKLFVEAPEYMRSVTEVDVEARKDVRARLTITKRPKTANVVVTANEVKLKKQVHFETDSARLLPDSMAIIEEIADVLTQHGELALVEIQGHTDNTGSEPYNKRLSQERADAVRDALTTLGVEESRLSSRGYGQELPLVPNSTDANRARNRRVQLIIKEKSK